jgi:hypothetical protein
MEGNTQPTPQQEAPKQENQQQAAPGSKDANNDIKGLVAQLEAFLDEHMVKKAPFVLPMGAKEFIVKVAPYLVIISAILALPLIFAALGLSAVVAPVALMGGYGWGFGAIISLAVSVIVLVMEVIAVPGLFKRTKGGWRMVFYASIVSFVGSIISITGIIGGIIGAIIGWYILFQVKELYKN